MPRTSDTIDVTVTVVCVTFNSAAVLPSCLAALPAGLAGIARWRLVVADNASADDSVAIVREQGPDGTVVVEMGGNLGYAAGINAAIAAVAEPGHVMVINPDARLGPGCVRALVDALDAGTGVAVPRILDDDGRVAPSLRRRPTVARVLAEAVLGGRRAARRGLGEVVAPGPAYATAARADWATGAALLVSQECREVVGHWDESFFLYSEETDYLLRAGDRGLAVTLVPGATVRHTGGEQGTAPELWALSVVNKARLHRKRHGTVPAAAMRAALALNELLRLRRGPVPRAALRALLSRDPDLPGRDRSDPPWICFAAQDWWYHNRAHSDFQLMTRVARDRPVLLVNSIGLRMPTPGRSTMVVRRILRKVRSMLKAVRRPLPDVPGFVVMTPVVVPLYQYPAVRAANAALVRWQVRVVAAALGIHRAVVFATIPTAADVVPGLRPSALLYNRSDRHSEFPESDRATIAALEDDLLRRADRVLYVSRALLDDDAPAVGERAEFLDHGVDLEHFARRAELPDPLQEVPGPRLGFFGGLDDYVVDVDLLERVALDLPHCSLVLVGDATFPMERLTRLPNVHWFGFRPYAEIPAWGSGFDVALMPWLDNEWIRVCNPIKLKEYLALGLPVVSTEYPEVDRYRDVVRVAADHAGFVKELRATLEDGGPGTAQTRRAAVESASWDAVTARLVRIARAAAAGRA